MIMRNVTDHPRPTLNPSNTALEFVQFLGVIIDVHTNIYIYILRRHTSCQKQLSGSILLYDLSFIPDVNQVLASI